MNRSETIKNLTEGRDKHLIALLSLEDWDKLPSEDIMNEINDVWNNYSRSADSFIRHIRYLMGEDTVTAEEVYNDLIRDSELRRKIVSYEFIEYMDGEHGFVEELEDRYDVFGQIIYDAMSEVRLQFHRNF